MRNIKLIRMEDGAEITKDSDITEDTKLCLVAKTPDGQVYGFEVDFMGK